MLNISRKHLKRLAWTLVAIVAAPVLLYGSIQVFRKPLVELLLSEIFKAEAEVEAVSLNFHTAFPYARAGLKNVAIKSKNPARPREDAFEIEEAYARLNPWKLVYRLLFAKDEQIRVDKIYAQDVKITFETDAEGRQNFYRMFKGNKPPEKRPAEVALPDMEIRRCLFSFKNRQKLREYVTYFDSLDVSLKVHPKKVTAKLDGKGRTGHIRAGNSYYLEHLPLAMKADLHYVKAKRQIRFMPGTVANFGETKAKIIGSLGMQKPGRYDLVFQTESGNFDALFGLVPRKARKQADNFRFDGLLNIVGSLKGIDSPEETPHIDLFFRSDSMEVTNRKTGGKIKNLAVSGVYTNGEKNSVETARLEIKKISGRIEDRPFEGYCTIENFSDVYVKGGLEARLFVPDLLKLGGLELKPGAAGEAEIDLKVSGRVRDLAKSASVENVDYNGSVKLTGVRAAPERAPLTFENISGSLKLLGGKLVLERLQGLVNRQPLFCRAQVFNLVPWLFGQDYALSASADIDLGALNLDQLIAEWEPPPDSLKAKRPPFRGVFQLPEDFSVNLGFNIDRLKFRGLATDEFRANFALRSQQLDLRSLVLRQGGDRVQVQASIDGRDKTRNRFQGKVALRSPHVLQLLQRAGLLPVETQNKTFRAGLDLGLEGWISKAPVVKGAYPRIRCRAVLDSAYFKDAAGNIRLERLKLVAQLTESHLFNFDHTSLLVDSISGTANDYKFGGKLFVEDWVKRASRLTVSSRISAPAFLRFFELDFIQNPRGTLDFITRIEGKLDNVLNLDSVFYQQYTGNLRIHNLGFRFAKSGLECRNVKANIAYNKARIRVRELNGWMEGTNFQIKGFLGNALPYLYGAGERLKADVDFEADTIDIERFIATRQSAKDREKKYYLTVPPHTDVQARLNVGAARFDRFSFGDISAAVSVKDRVAELEHLVAQTCGGRMNVDAKVDARTADTLKVLSSVMLTEMNVKQLMFNLRNFRQKVVTDENLEGVLNAQLTLSSILPSTLETDHRYTNFHLNFDITDGRLKNFKPFEKIDLFISDKYKKDLPFIIRGRNVNMRDRFIYFPALELRSAIVDALFSGHYTVDGAFRYELAVLRQGGKKRRRAKELHKSALDRYKNSPLVFVMRGDPDGFTVKYRGDKALTNLFRKLVPNWLDEKKFWME